MSVPDSATLLRLAGGSIILSIIVQSLHDGVFPENLAELV